MTVDVATLVFEFKSDSAAQAEKAMDRLIERGDRLDITAKKVRRATDSVNEAHRSAAGAAERNAQGAMALANAEGAVEKATRKSIGTAAELRALRALDARQMREVAAQQRAAAAEQAATQKAAAAAAKAAAAEQAAAAKAVAAAEKAAAAERQAAQRAAAQEAKATAAAEAAAGKARADAIREAQRLELRIQAERVQLMKQEQREQAAAAKALDAQIASAMAGHERLNGTLIKSVGVQKAATQAGLNLSRQFADIGVTAAMGMNPLMILIQQGPQIADALQTAKAQGVSFSQAMKGLGVQLGVVRTVLPPVIAAELELVTAQQAAAATALEVAVAERAKAAGTAQAAVADEAAAVAAAELATVNQAVAATATRAAAAEGLMLAPLGAVLGVVATIGAVAVAGFGLFEREVDKNTKYATTWGDTWKATVKVVGDVIMDGPIGKGLRWLGGFFGKILDAIVDGVMWFADKVVGHFGAAYQLIVKNWRRLPEVFGVIVQGAANITIQAVEGLVNKTIDGINYLLKAAGKATLGHIDLPEVKLANAKLAADYEKTANSISASFKKSRESLFDRISAQADKEYLARQKAAKGATEHAKATKQEADAHADAIKEIDRFLETIAREQAVAGMSPEQIKIMDAQAMAAKAIAEGYDIAAMAILRYADALILAEGAQKAWKADFVTTPADIKPVTSALDGWIQRMEEGVRKYQDIRNASDELFYGIKNQDWSQAFSGLLRTLSQVQQAFRKTATTADKVNAAAGVADAVGNAVGGRGGKAISSAASAGATAFQATGNPYVAAAAAAVAGLSALLKAKPSNQGAGYSLVTGEFTGKSRTADTEKAAKAAADIISGGQDLLRSAGLTLTETIHGLVIGSRDLSQVYTTGGRTVTAAVGDVAAAAEAGLRAVLETATYASAEQEKVAKSALAAGKSFDEVIAILDAYKAAQGILGSIEDEILRLQKPQAYDEQEVRREIQAQRDAAKSAYDAGYLTADMLAKINTELGTLEALRLDEVLARYANAANDNLATLHSATESAESMLMDAYNAFAEAKRAEIDALRQAAEGLKAFRKELDFGAIAGRDPISQYAATKREFDRLNALSATDPERLANLQSVGQAFVEASRAASPTQLAFDRDLNAVRRATEASQLAATAQADLAQMELDAQTAAVGQLIQLNGTAISIAQAIANLTVARANEKAAGGAVNDNLDVGRYLASNPDLVANWNDGGIMRSLGGSLEEAVRAQYAGWGKNEIAQGLRTYATGGMHPGGLRLVGEEGPELEATGPARIYSARDTARMMGGDNSEMVAELRALRETVASQAQELRRIAVATDQTQNKLKDIEGNGMFVRGRAPDDPVPTKEAA